MIDPNPLGRFRSREDLDTVDSPVPVFSNLGTQPHGLRFGARDFNFDYLSRNGAVVETLMDHFRAPHWDPLIRELDAKDKVIDHLSKRLARARGSVEVASLVLESVTEASRQGSLSEEHQRLCQSAQRSSDRTRTMSRHSPSACPACQPANSIANRPPPTRDILTSCGVRLRR